MSESNGYEDILIEIARKHGVALGKKDPILIVYTLNQKMIEDQTKAQEKLFDEFRSQMEESTQSWHLESKKRAETILTASLDASKKAMLNTMTDNAKAASNAVREEFNGLADIITQKMNESRQTSYINLIASFVTLAASCIVLYGFIKG